MVKPYILTIPNTHVKISPCKYFSIDLETCRFPKGLIPMEINHFELKISKFLNRLIFDMHVGDG